MTIDEAIKLLTDLRKDPNKAHPLNTLDAIKLGIEALKRIKKLRTYEYFGYDSSLEGETKE